MAISDAGFILTNDVVANGLGHYSESDEGGQEDYSASNGRSTRVFITNFADRADFMDALMGYPSIAGNALARTLPDNHPDYPPLYCVDATSKGFGRTSIGPNGAGAWTAAKITAIYESLPYLVLDDGSTGGNELNRFCERSYGLSSQYLTGQGFMQWVSRTTNKGLNVPPGRIVGATQYTIVWHDVPGGQTNALQPLSQTIASLTGCVNNKAFDGYLPGSVLFLGAEPRISKPRLTAKPGQAGFFLWDMVYQFLIVRDNPTLYPPLDGVGGVDPVGEVAGHNYVYDFSPGAGIQPRWDMITSDGNAPADANGNTTQYKYADLNQLFQINQP